MALGAVAAVRSAGRTGQVIGRKTKLKFDGENETIDRRTMVFAGGKKKDNDGY